MPDIMTRLKMKKDADPPEVRRKIAPEDVAVGLRADEIGRILNLKKDLDYSDVLSKYACRYLKIGWDLVAVNPRGKSDLELDFRQDQEIWGKRLAELGMEGVQVNLGVRTGSSSNLVVLEVRPGEDGLPFGNGDDWRSGCVAEVGGGWEQHYYVLPQGWPIPSSSFLDPHRLMVFGAGGMVLAPPSLEPRVQDNLRWLRPPWENPPSRPNQRLWQFLMEHVPIGAAPEFQEELPQPPAWEDIYGTISVHPAVLQTLLAPAASPEEYYAQLLHSAVGSGLTDPQLLLGLLWHAPLGDARQRPQGLQELQKLIAGTLGGQPQSTGDLDRVTSLLQELQGAFAALSSGGSPPAISPPPPPRQAQPPAPVPTRFTPPEPRPGPGNNFSFQGQNFNLPEVYGQSNTKVLWKPRESIAVERDRYEAMLYELGKLGAWHEIQQEHTQELKTLKEKIEAQQQKEITRLRRLCTQNQEQTAKKKDKSWWR